MTVVLTELKCPGCGAPLRYRPGSPIHSCPFCGSSIAVTFAERNGEEVLGEAYRIREFEVSRDEFSSQLLGWLADGDYTPDDILSAVLVSDFTGVFVPLYRLRGEYKATFSASAGYEREETYYEERTDSGGNREQVRKTRTVVDWRPMNGEASDEYVIWVSASEKVPESLVAWVEQRAGAQDTWRDFDEALLEGYALEAFAMEPDVAMQQRGRALIEQAVEDRCRSRVPGEKCKDLRVDFTTRDEAHDRVYHPFWLASFEYRGENHHYAQCGQQSDQHEGTRPVDAERQQAVKALMKPVWISAIVWVVVGIVGIILAFIPTILALVVGLPMTIWLYARANRKKKAILDRSRELRQRVLELARRGGGVRKGSGLGIAASSVERIRAELAVEGDGDAEG